MGSGRFDSNAYRSFSASTATKSREELFDKRHMHKNLNPHGVKTRESRDSADNPESTPVIVALDVTGSMGMLAETIARQGLGTLFTSILENKPITDPHVMFMAIGDAYCDGAPLQVSQFEADLRIVEQLTQIYLEGGGGGNDSESYNLPWYFAGFHVSHDCFEKRAKKGYLFTVGDECTPSDLNVKQIKAVCGDDLQQPLSSKEMLQLAQRTFHVFHVNIMEGSYARSHGEKVNRSWGNMLGQNVIHLADHHKLSEVIVATIAMTEGQDVADATKSWDKHTAKLVHDAVKHLPSPGRPQLGYTA